MSFMRYLAAGAAASALSFALSAPGAYAQQTTGAIRGTVVDAKGAAVKGATVTISHLPTATDTTLMTDDAGGFDAPGLRVGGPYRVSVSAPGASQETVNDIYLAVGDQQRLRLMLRPANEVAAIAVTASSVGATTQLANVGSKTTLRRENIESVVSVRRDIRDIARRDPLAQLDLNARSTGPSGGLYIAGSTPRSNRITIDGVRSADSFGLNTGGLSTNRGPVSPEAIEQAVIQAAPFDVEDGDFTGGALNLILRSGSNTFHGSAFDNFRSSRFTGNQLPVYSFLNGDVTQPNPVTYAKVRTNIHEKNYGAFLSGPIIKDKLFFAASYEKFSSSDVTGFGPIGAGFPNTFARIPGISTGTGASQTDIDTVLSNWNGYAQSSALKPGEVQLTEPIIDEKSSIKIDWNITDGQRLTATYRHAYSSVWKRSPSITNIYLETNWYVQPETEDNYALQLNSNWTPTLSTEARITYRPYERGQNPPEGQGFGNVTICTDPTSAGSLTSCTGGVPQIQFGPDQFRQANVLKTKEKTGEFIARYSGFENHLIKAGVQYRHMDVFDLFVQAAHGVYYFDSVADFAAGRANQLTYGGPIAGSLLGAAAVDNYSVTTGLLQDTWDINERLTLNYGVRYDHYGMGDQPTLNTNFVARYGYSNQTNFDGLNVFMPRVSAKYRSQTWQLSGGVGLFSGGLPDVFITNSYGATTGAAVNTILVQRQANGTFLESSSATVLTADQGNALLSNLKANPSFLTSASSVANTLVTADSATQRKAYTNSLAPDFKMPSDWKANVSFRTTQLGLDFAIDGVATWSQKNIAFRDIRARPLTVNGVQQYTPDGRIRYDGLVVPGATPAAVNAARQAAGLPVSSNPDLANVGDFGDIQAYNPDQKTWTETVAFSVGKHVNGWWGDLDGFVAYTLQRGKQYGGLGEFGTTEGGNGRTGNLYSDQSFSTDPNAAARGDLNNRIDDALKIDLAYKFEWKPGWVSRLTLFGEKHSGRPINFLMTDPVNTSGRSPTFGVIRDDGLVYVPNLGSPDASNPLKFTTSGTTVIFDSAASLAKFKALVAQFNLPQGKIVPKGFGRNPSVSRIDMQLAQEVPTPVLGSVLFTLDIANLGNLINKKWGVVREYTNSRSGGVVVNAQCADSAGNAVPASSPICQTYRYSYATASPTALAVPTVDPGASLWSIVFGIKYKF